MLTIWKTKEKDNNNKMSLYKFQKDIAYHIAYRLQHAQTVVITIPSGYGKKHIMKEVSRLINLKKQLKKK